MSDIVPVTAERQRRRRRRRTSGSWSTEQRAAEPKTRRALRAELGHPHRSRTAPTSSRPGPATRPATRTTSGAGDRQRREHRPLPERGPRDRLRPPDHASSSCPTAGCSSVSSPGRSTSCRRPYTTPTRPRSCSSPTSARRASSRACTTSCSTPTSTTNRFFYVFYTLGTPNHDRSRGSPPTPTLTGTVPGSEFVLYEDPQNANAEHHGGSLNFANDGKLLFTTGEHFDPARLAGPHQPARARSTGSTRTARVPTDNPFFDGAGPNSTAIWARGLRNPFRAYYDAPTGRYYIADVGGNDPVDRRGGDQHRRAGRELRLARQRGHLLAALHEPAVLLPAQRPRRLDHRRLRLPRHRSSRARYRRRLLLRRLHPELDQGAEASTPTAPSPTSFDFEPVRRHRRRPLRRHRLPRPRVPRARSTTSTSATRDIGGAFGVSKIRRISYIELQPAPGGARVGEPGLGPDAARGPLLERRLVRPGGPAAHLLVGLRRRHDLDRGQPDAHLLARAGPYQARLTVSDGVNNSISTPIAISAGNVPTATILTPANDARRSRPAT